jgi:nucleoside-diphosphate-sugar epimerase
MRYFITGAAGYIGIALVQELTRARQEVIGLVRTDAQAGTLRGLGARAVHGTMEDPQSYADAAADCDVAIHLATARGPNRAQYDRLMIETMLDAAQSTPHKRVVIYTSSVWVLPDSTQIGDAQQPDESCATHAAQTVAWRPGHEYVTLNGATDFVATAVVRPGVVYGGKGGRVGTLFDSAVKSGAAEYVGDGTNRWSVVHREDLARLYRRVAEKRARGIFHAVEEEPLALERIARACSEAAGSGAVRSLPLAEARRALGAAADALAGDRPVASVHARALGWSPEWKFARDISETWNEWRGQGV